MSDADSNSAGGSLDSVFRPVRQRAVFSYGVDTRPDPFDVAARTPPAPCGVQPRVSAEEFGGSLSEVLQRSRRLQSEAAPEPPAPPTDATAQCARRRMQS